MNQAADKKPVADEANARRSFLAAAAAIVTGGIVAVFPFAAGLGVVFDPLRRRRGVTAENDSAAPVQLIRICQLDALPADGVPRMFAVVTDVADAWSRIPNQRIGSVYLTRTDADGKPSVTCFTTVCPHLGCAVDYQAADGQYECPCHESGFAKDGKKLFGPSLRGLDALKVTLVDEDGQTDVFVAYERFRTGIAERISV
jgi:Rieske Fe-S protein